MKFEFSRQIFEKSQIWSLIKIRPVGVELFPAVGQTDGQTKGRRVRHDEANSRFSQFRKQA